VERMWETLFFDAGFYRALVPAHYYVANVVDSGFEGEDICQHNVSLMRGVESGCRGHTVEVEKRLAGLLVNETRLVGADCTRRTAGGQGTSGSSQLRTKGGKVEVSPSAREEAVHGSPNSCWKLLPR